MLQVQQKMNKELFSWMTFQALMRSLANFDLTVFWVGGEVGNILRAFAKIKSFPIFILSSLAFLASSRMEFQPWTREVTVIIICLWLHEIGLEFEAFFEK